MAESRSLLLGNCVRDDDEDSLGSDHISVGGGGGGGGVESLKIDIVPGIAKGRQWPVLLGWVFVRSLRY